MGWLQMRCVLPLSLAHPYTFPYLSLRTVFAILLFTKCFLRMKL
ncbi:hypothetical protein BACFIN_09065 [Bacteroides finegoldii DSM 17565]|nr:hypothetical protein BACFIN_09065 [Bacteroides finegoldii DSM 17565]